MIVSTFEDDLLQLKDFADRLNKFIDVERDYVEGSLVIALSSKYGSGKSSFLQMWKTSFEDPEDKSNTPFVISLNAWESDYYGDPLYAIISELVNAVQDKGESAKELISAAKDFGWFATAIGGQVTKKFTGVDPVAAGGLSEKKKAERNEMVQLAPDTFSIYQDRKNAMSTLKNAIRDFVEGAESRVLFLVDELDRCRPDYAISYLETIKHIFDVKGAVFVLAADRHHLENSARTAFGSKLDFEEYYRKFVHREVTLPNISEIGYKNLVSKYVQYYLEREGSRNCFMKLDGYRVEDMSKFIGALKLTPRQIQEVFRILGHIFDASEEEKGNLLWCLAVGSIVMASLKVGESRIFHLLGSQSIDPKEAYDFLERLLGGDNIDYWFTLFLTGGGLRLEEGESSIDVMIKLGMLEGEASNHSGELVQWHQGWGLSYSSRFAEIHEKIEQLSKWSK